MTSRVASMPRTSGPWALLSQLAAAGTDLQAWCSTCGHQAVLRIGAILEGVVLFAVLWWFSAKPRANGAVSAVFLIGYGTVRFVAEFFREPDAGIFGLSYTISMGQWLSLPMIAAGVAMLVWANKAASK